MKKILFVCHGNICRSPMAEFVFRNMVKKAGLSDKIHIASAATSREELGNPVHHGTVAKLAPLGISTKGKYAVQMTKADYDEYDLLLAMDQYNVRNMLRIVGSDPDNKIMRLLDIADNPRDIADPWYTGNFDVTYNDIVEGCNALLKKLF